MLAWPPTMHSNDEFSGEQVIDNAGY